jgi:hypothetical protein
MDLQEITARLSTLKALNVVDVRSSGHEMSWFLQEGFMDKLLDKMSVKLKKKKQAVDLAYEAMCELLVELPISEADVQRFGEVLWPIVARGAQGMFEPTMEAA